MAEWLHSLPLLSGPPPDLLGPKASKSQGVLTRQVLYTGRGGWAALLQASSPSWTLVDRQGKREGRKAGVQSRAGRQPLGG